MKYSEVVQLERLLEKYKDAYASKTMKSKIDSLAKQVKKKAADLKDTGYRFFVCKKGSKFCGIDGKEDQEYVPVAPPFRTLNEANDWMRKTGSLANDELFAIKAPKDMWDMDDIEWIVVE